MRIIIIYKKYIYEDKNLPVIGGIQNYIENLVNLILEMGHEVVVIQESSFSFIRELQRGFFVHGVKTSNSIKGLISYAYEISNIDEDLLIFATSTNTQRTKFKKTISIQHGVYWDYNTIHNMKPKFPFDIFLKFVQAYSEIRKQSHIGTLVAVDYNYINWYRSITIHHKLNYVVIPNFSHSIPESNKKESNNITIIYARRLEKIRGTELLIKVIPKVLNRYKNVSVIIAGDGSQEEIVKEKFKMFESVKFIRYQPSESLEIHSKCDIAIVPTIASEGTSFSLLEAMSAGCAVINTDIGGMTNIILNEFNGLMIKPDEEMLLKTISRLIEDKQLRNKLAINALMTTKEAFSKKVWKNAWKNLIESYDS